MCATTNNIYTQGSDQPIVPTDRSCCCMAKDTILCSITACCVQQNLINTHVGVAVCRAGVVVRHLNNELAKLQQAVTLQHLNTRSAATSSNISLPTASYRACTLCTWLGRRNADFLQQILCLFIAFCLPSEISNRWSVLHARNWAKQWIMKAKSQSLCWYPFIRLGVVGQFKNIQRFCLPASCRLKQLNDHKNRRRH